MRLFFGLALPGSLYRHPMKGAVFGDDHVVVIARPHESVLSPWRTSFKPCFSFSFAMWVQRDWPKRVHAVEESPGLAGATRGSGTARRRRPETARFFMVAPVPLPVVEVSLGSCQRRAGAPHLKRSRMQL